VPTQVPFAHAWFAAQAWPQPPQLLASVLVSTQAPPHKVSSQAPAHALDPGGLVRPSEQGVHDAAFCVLL
jgi:hypothetical protein